MRRSIRVRLTIAFIGLAVSPLFLVGVVLAWRSYAVQRDQSLQLQRQVVERVSSQVAAFFGEMEDELGVVGRVQGLPRLERERQREVLSELASYQRAFEELILFDARGQERAHVSRLRFGSPGPSAAREPGEQFAVSKTSGRVSYSAVRFEPSTGE